MNDSTKPDPFKQFGPVRIVSNGTALGTKVYDMHGEELTGGRLCIRAIDINIDVDDGVSATLEIAGNVELELDGVEAATFTPELSRADASLALPPGPADEPTEGQRWSVSRARLCGKQTIGDEGLAKLRRVNDMLERVSEVETRGLQVTDDRALDPTGRRPLRGNADA